MSERPPITPRFALKWAVKAVTPPILILGAKTVLVRLGLLRRRPEEAAAEPPPAGPPEWEYLAEGFARRAAGWDAAAVAGAYAAKWPSFLAAVEGSGPLGVNHEVRTGEPVPRDDLAAHNTIVSFAYALARAAHGRTRISVLDWGGALGHYHVLARALLPDVDLDWHVRETPAVAARGRELNPAVTFHGDDEAALARTYDLVLVSASLQYAEEWAALLGRLARASGAWLYAARVPVALDAGSFVVLQRAQAYGYDTEYAGWVIARGELLERAAAAGLELERELLLDAWLSAEGAPEAPTPHRSFLFRRRG